MKAKLTRRAGPLLGLLLLAACGSQRAERDTSGPVAGELRRAGTIDFPVTCAAAVRDDFETAVALLHSFFYDEARRRFLDIAARDPGCAMAWWGVAMTWYHPLWAPPTAVERAKGLAAVERARATGGATELERGMIDAIAAFFTTNEVEDLGAGPPAGCACCGPQAHGARAQAFRTAFERLHARFPDEVEVTTFYALALLGTVPPADETYAQQCAAAALLEPLFERHPDHPGIAHYIIHAYDYPELAERALIAAHEYGDIAPWVPHALHMPSHIYTRLGMWEQSIASNLASSQAARDHAARRFDGRATMDDLHAMDYLMFAYLQRADDDAAERVLEELWAIEAVEPGNEFASAYALAAIPARFVLERRDWRAAARLTAPRPEVVGRYPMAAAHIEFARAVGGARSGDLATAATAVQRLVELRDSLPGTHFSWWTDQVEIQRLAASAWLERAEGRAGAAIRTMRSAARIEDEAGTHPVTPGQILPVREQLGEMLFGCADPAEALVEFELSLEAFPRRLASHVGAARAAIETGRIDVARRHYRAIVEMAGATGAHREAVAIARAALDGD